MGDLLWWEKRPDVLREISDLLGSGSTNTDTLTPGWFGLRTSASRNILERMTEAEKSDLRKIGDDMVKNGMLEHLQ